MNKPLFQLKELVELNCLRKIRKAQLINEFLKENKIEVIIADHWKSLELN